MSRDQDVDRLASLLANSARIVVLTGAGMSTESGIPDFRSEGGVWEDEDLLAAMSDGYLRRSPEDFWPKFKATFLNQRFLTAVPNRGHQALVQLEKMGKQVEVYTQNVDGLHQQSGSSRVMEIHGNARTAYCPRCHHEYDLDYVLEHPVPRCSWETQKGGVCDTILHPDTVLFGQAVRYLNECIDELGRTDLFLILGTSLTVDPVASLPMYKPRGCPLVIINLDETRFDSMADLRIHEKIGDVLPLAVSRL